MTWRITPQYIYIYSTRTRISVQMPIAQCFTDPLHTFIARRFRWAHDILAKVFAPLPAIYDSNAGRWFHLGPGQANRKHFCSQLAARQSAVATSMAVCHDPEGEEIKRNKSRLGAQHMWWNNSKLAIWTKNLIPWKCYEFK